MKDSQDKENNSERFRTPPLSSDIEPRVSNDAGQYPDTPTTAPVHPQMPYNDAQGLSTPLKFGLIRGYHRQMYATPSTEDLNDSETPCCPSKPVTGLKQVHPLDRINWGVVCGCVLLILGIATVLIGLLFPQQAYESLHPTERHTRKERNDILLFSDVCVIGGLSVLSVAGAVISVALLFPLIRRKRREHVYRHQEEPINFFGSEVYVKAENNGSKKQSETEEKEAVSLGFLRDFDPGDVFLRKVQPSEKKYESEPIDPDSTTTGSKTS